MDFEKLRKTTYLHNGGRIPKFQVPAGAVESIDPVLQALRGMTDIDIQTGATFTNGGRTYQYTNNSWSLQQAPSTEQAVPAAETQTVTNPVVSSANGTTAEIQPSANTADSVTDWKNANADISAIKSQIEEVRNKRRAGEYANYASYQAALNSAKTVNNGENGETDNIYSLKRRKADLWLHNKEVRQEALRQSNEQARQNLEQIGDNALSGMSGLGDKYLTRGEDGKLDSGGLKNAGIAVAGKAAVKGMEMLDAATMGDKNFGAQSAAIDSATHAVSGALMSTGNPYCVCKGTQILLHNGTTKNVEDITLDDTVLGYQNKGICQESVEILMTRQKECLEIETESGNILQCSIDHPIYSTTKGRARYVTVGKKKQRRIKDFSFKEAQELTIGDYVAEIGEIPVFGSKHIKNAYLIGLLIGDGTYGKHKTPRLFTADPDTWRYVESTGLATLYKKYLPGGRYNKEFREYKFFGFQGVLREHGIYTQTKKEKRLPIDLKDWDKESCAQLIAGLIDTDGCVQDHTKEHAGIIFYQSNIILLKEVKSLLLKFGIHTTIETFKPKDIFIKNRIIHKGEGFSLVIKKRESVINFYNNITLNIDYKQKALTNAYLLKASCKGRDTSFEFHGVISDRIKRVTPIGIQDVYNLQVSGSHTFIADNIITHNCMLAAGAIETANFLTKAGGETVQGFDVDINSSGYGNLGHMESSSSRDFGAMFGLGGLNRNKMQAKLERRNEQARMALTAAQIADDSNFEKEARMNSVENTIMNNQIALAGGLDTGVLGG